MSSSGATTSDDSPTKATPAMAAYCLEVIAAALDGRPPEGVPCAADIPDDPHPVFVTLETLPEAHLRGCIGCFNAAPLREQLRTYALAAAFEDSRFRSLEKRELSTLRCTVSVLFGFEPCARWDDWVIGKHGVRVSFMGKYGSTFLPKVAEEMGYDHLTTLKQLALKAGYRGTVDEAFLLTQTKVTRYQVSLASVDYATMP